MRTIKFRGFTNDSEENKWVYGFLTSETDITYKLSFIEITREVDKETISQFTGLYDVNEGEIGREIYEGDIVKLGFTDTKYYNNTYKIVYSEKFAGFFLSDLHSKEESRSSLLTISEYIIKKYKIKVIGNIHELRK